MRLLSTFRFSEGGSSLGVPSLPPPESMGTRAHTCAHTCARTSKDAGVACLFIKIIRSNSVVSQSTRILLLELHHHNDGTSPAHGAQVSLGDQPTLSHPHIPTAGHTRTPGMHTGTLLPQVLTTCTRAPSAQSLGQQGPAAPLPLLPFPPHSHPSSGHLPELCVCVYKVGRAGGPSV